MPIGVFLSGGIDSSTVAKICADQLSSIDTYSIGFDDPSYDESSHARLMARALGSNHHEKIFTLEEAKSRVNSILNKLGEPLGDSSLLPTFLSVNLPLKT